MESDRNNDILFFVLVLILISVSWYLEARGCRDIEGNILLIPTPSNQGGGRNEEKIAVVTVAQDPNNLQEPPVNCITSGESRAKDAREWRQILSLIVGFYIGSILEFFLFVDRKGRA